MFTLVMRKSLNLIMATSLLIGSAGGHSTSSAIGGSSPSSITPSTLQTSFATQFTYDPNGNLASRTDANGAITEYEYDADNRLISISYPDRSSVKFTYDSLGQRTRMTDSLGTTSYEYDIHGRLVKVTDPNGYALQYAYDPRGLMTQLVYPDGSAAAYTWDANGQLATVQDASGITKYEYDLGGNLTGRILPNGVNTHYEYDNASRLIAIRHTDSSGALLLGFEYQLDAAGNRIQVSQTGSDGTQVTRYQYDSLNRLVKVTYQDSEAVSYTYDATGNRTSLDSSKKGNTSYLYNGLGQLTQLDGPEGKVTFRYDANGNLLDRADKKSHRTTHYTWDYENRMVGVDDGATKISYEYAGNSNRIGKTVNGKPTEYVNNINGFILQTLSEINSDGETRNYSYGIERISQIDSGGSESFYITDGLEGSVSNLIDSEGRITDSYTYDAFGNTTVQMGRSGNPFAYDGEYADGETGLIFLRNRYYDPAIGRFLSSDVHMGLQVNPQSLNPYVFARNNPINFVDPLGLDDWVRGFGLWIKNIIRTSFVRVSDLNPDLLLLDAIGEKYRMNWFGETISGGRYILPGGVGDPGVKPVNWVDWWAMKHDQDYYAVTRYLFPGTGFEGRWLERGVNLIFVNVKVGLGILGEGLLRGGILGNLIIDLLDQREYGSYTREGPYYDGGDGSQSTPDLFQSLYIGDDTWDDNLNRYFPLPMCPPFCGDGGGGGAAVGGVSLDQAAEVLVNLNDITGATYDPRTGQVVLIGRKDLALPKMNLDDLVVAIRSIYTGQEPSMSIEPCNPGVQNGCMKVLYNGRFVDPNQSGTVWVTYDANGQLAKVDPPATFGTHFGWVIFEADRYLKTSSLGKDNSNPGQAFQTNVPGFISELELMAASSVSKSGSQHRMWFVPDAITVTVSADGHTMEFEPTTILTQAHFVSFNASGQMVDVPGNDPAVDAFVAHWNNYYDDFAGEKDELAELIQLAKIVGLIRWIQDNNIPMDLAWVDRYEVPPATTPITTTAILASSGNMSLYGGVEFPPDNSYQTNNAAMTALSNAALSARPSAADLTWGFEHDSETLTAVALNLAPAEIIGGYSTTRTDMAVPVAGGLVAEFTRQYNSLDLGAGPLGSGWSQVIPALTFQTAPAPDDPASHYTQAVITAGTDRATFTFGEDGFFYPNDMRASSEVLGITYGDPFNPLSLPEGYSPHPGLPGQPLEVQDAQSRSLAYSGFALLKQDCSVLAFDPSGKLIGQRDAEGRTLNYTYDGERLTAIADTSGHSLQFIHDSNGWLTDLTASNGQVIHYTYDSSGYLNSVFDETDVQLAGYAYDANGRLNRITDQYGRASEIAYDGLGRVISSQSSSGSSSTQYNTALNQVTYTNAAGNTIVRQYDDQNRLLSETDPLGNAVKYQYDEEGYITAFTDPNGNTTSFAYDEFGNLTETVSPLGDRTILWNYNELGLPRGSIDPANRYTKYEYDEQGRVTGVTSGLQVTDILSNGGILYDDNNKLSITYSYDAAGNLATVQDAAGSVTHYTYDDLGNLTAVQLPGGGKVRQTFDDRSRLTSIADATGYLVDFGYDELGQLASITTPAGQTQYQYTNGLVAAVTDPLNNTLQYGYDAASRLASVTEPGGGVTIYEYDASGNLVTVKDALGRQTQFKYDAAGRVVGITYGNGDVTVTGTPSPKILSTPPVYFWLAGGLALVGVLIGLAFVFQRRRCPMCGARAARKSEFCPKCGMTLCSV